MTNRSRTLKYFWNFLICALGALFVVNSLQTYQSMKVLDLNASRSGNTNEIVQLAGNTYFAIQNAEFHLRDYMLDEAQPDLDKYDQAVDKVKLLINELQTLSTEFPIQRSRFKELLDIINSHDKALAAAVEQIKASRIIQNQPDTTVDELSLHKVEAEKKQAQSLSEIMTASHQSLEMLSELIYTIEKEEQRHIQAIMDESAQRRGEISQAMLIANCLGIGFIIIIAMLISRAARQQSDYADLLERKVRERTQELELYALELSRSNRELQSFAFVASHDLQEPLRKIQAFGDRLSDRYSDSLGGGKDYVVRMQSAASRMSKLIEDLLAFSRVSTRRKPFEQVDLNETLADVLDDLQFKIDKTGAKISSDPLPTLSADPMQMSQLLLNLVGNALKFVKPDTAPIIQITAKATSLPCLNGEGDGQPATEISIQDNGIGFDEAFMDKIFSAFQRLHHRDEYEGTGIGLAICRRIIERHGGSIAARSELGRGTTFTIILPLELKDVTLPPHSDIDLQSTSNSLPGSSSGISESFT